MKKDEMHWEGTRLRLCPPGTGLDEEARALAGWIGLIAGEDAATHARGLAEEVATAVTEGPPGAQRAAAAWEQLAEAVAEVAPAYVTVMRDPIRGAIWAGPDLEAIKWAEHEGVIERSGECAPGETLVAQTSPDGEVLRLVRRRVEVEEVWPPPDSS